MKAMISGHAATALVNHGEEWLRIDAYDPVPMLSGSHDYRRLFGRAEDVQYVEAASLDEVRQKLSIAVANDTALSLSLIVLDPDTKDDDLRDRAATQLSGMPIHAVDFVEKVLFARPLDGRARFDDAIRLTHGSAKKFMTRLRDLQPSICLVSDAWDAIPDGDFGAIDAEDLLVAAVHSGLVRDFVEAAVDRVIPPIRDEVVVNLPDRARVVYGRWRQVLKANYPRRVEPVVTVQPSTENAVAYAPESIVLPPTYLTAADPELLALEPALDFESALAKNVLFQFQLLIPDRFFFNSTGVQDHMCRSAPTLLEGALENGLVVAAFRHPDTDFLACHSFLREDGIVGYDTNDIAERLERAAEKAPQSPYVYWPTRGMDEGLAERLSILQTPEPPSTGLVSLDDSMATLRSRWAETELWRTRVLDAAKEGTVRQPNGRGVWKRIILGKLAESLQVSPSSVRTIRDLLNKTKDPKLHEALRVFWHWIAEAYRSNQAHMLGAVASSPGYNEIQDIFATRALSAMHGLPSTEIEVKLPPAVTLARVPASEILKLRTGPGAEYFRTLSAWQAAVANPKREAEFHSAVETYSEAIVKVTERHEPFAPELVQVKIGFSNIISGSTPVGFGSLSTFPTIGSRVKHAVLKNLPLITEPGVGPVVKGLRTDVSVAERRPPKTLV